MKHIYPDLKRDGITIYVQGTAQEDLPEGFHSIDDMLKDASSAPIDPSVRAGLDEKYPLCYIYTSGTTGKFLFSVLYLYLRNNGYIFFKCYIYISATTGEFLFHVCFHHVCSLHGFEERKQSESHNSTSASKS